MRILAYSYRTDESEYFQQFSKKYGVEIVACPEAPRPENVEMARGFTCISIITTMIPAELVEAFHAVGVKFISTRTVGYDHIDTNKARKLGIRVGHVTYSPNSVADYTIMLMLMAIRKMKAIMERSQVQDYSLRGVRGKEMPNLTVGVMGTGRIGQTVVKHLSGFGCRLLAYDWQENEAVRPYAEYVTRERLFAESDLISLHMPATADTYHMINRHSMAMMKDGVFIVNTARGALIHTEDLIQGLEQGKIGGAALDVIENEAHLYYHDLKCEILCNRELAILRGFPNVIVSPHTAFYTDQAVSDMVEYSILSCILFMEGKDNPWEVD